LDKNSEGRAKAKKRKSALTDTPAFGTVKTIHLPVTGTDAG